MKTGRAILVSKDGRSAYRIGPDGAYRKLPDEEAKAAILKMAQQEAARKELQEANERLAGVGLIHPEQGRLVRP